MPMSKKKMLVIEDDLTNMELFADLLDAAGHEVIQAHSAEEGIALAAETVPDLILMDVALPGMDGLEATRRLRADPAVSSVPVVAVTSYAMEGDQAKAMAAGCAGYITKPIDTRTFVSTVEKYVARGSDCEK